MIFFKNGGWEIVDLEIPKAIETTLNLVKDLQRKNFELNQKNEYYAWLNKDLKDEIKRLKKELNNE